jgi:ethanolamine ammonia-lyase small subunit
VSAGEDPAGPVTPPAPSGPGQPDPRAARPGAAAGDPAPHPAWTTLRTLTAARIGLARSGASLGTGPLLEFRRAHAMARDAVHAALDEAALLAALDRPVLVAASAAADRRTYLMRPDLGRRLADPAALAAHAGVFDLAIVLGDGLSALALQRHAAPLLRALAPALHGWALAPLVLVHGARVAVGDQVATALGAAAVLILLGERPGLSAPDSLGAYLTWAPGPATTDADRNCVSNIRPEGLPYADAAHRLAYLLREMRRLRRSGVALKDESAGPPRLEG